MSCARTSGLIVPVDAARPLIAKWLDLLPHASRALPPHVTALWPFLPADALDARVERDLESIFAGIPAFEFSLESVSSFANAVYLAPEPPDPFVELTRVLWERWPECPPFGGAYDDIVPHLSVAVDPGPGLRVEIECALAPRLPVLAHAVAVLLVVEDGEGVLAPEHRFALGGDPAPAENAG